MQRRTSDKGLTHVRLPTGVGKMAHSIVEGTSDRFQWVHIGASSLSSDQAVFSHNVGNTAILIYSASSFSNRDLLRYVIHKEKPDVLVHFTDPHQWMWLYEMENEIRRQLPIVYYTVWDNLPDPQYNLKYYRCCDQLLCISKLTYGVCKRMLKEYADPWQIRYVPHGVDEEIYRPSDAALPKESNGKFVILVNNVNLRRKELPTIVQAFSMFAQQTGCENSELVLHTRGVASEGTDLWALTESLPETVRSRILLDETKYDEETLVDLYRYASVTINVASQEGFGLATLESLLSGTPIIVVVTGGLQDQCGFSWPSTGLCLTEDDYIEIGSLHDRIAEDFAWGSWVHPIWPSVSRMTGSPVAPYIFEDIVSSKSVVEAFNFWFEMPDCERIGAGAEGREFAVSHFSSKRMTSEFAEAIDELIKHWTPPKRYDLREVCLQN